MGDVPMRLSRWVYAVCPGILWICVAVASADPLALEDNAVTSEGRAVDIAVLANDYEPDGDVLKVVKVTRGANGWVLINGDDTVRYRPKIGFTGLDGFAYTVSDSEGGRATATVSVTVEDAADAPVAEDQTVETQEDTGVAITLVGTDADGDRLTFEIRKPTARGSLGGMPPNITYVPDEDYSGTDSFVFSVDDGNGGIDTGRVSIRIEPVEDAPVALEDHGVTNEGRAVDIVVLGNDYEPDGDVLRVISVTQGASGRVLVNGDDTVRYQPKLGFTGLDGFAYTVSDRRGMTAAATVSVTVEDVADAPVAEDQTVETKEDTGVAISLVGTDADGDRLTFDIVKTPARGSLRGMPPNITYVPDEDYYGTDGFVFSVDDGNGGIDTGRVSIRIVPDDDAPVAREDHGVTDEGRAVDIVVLANDREPDGDVLRVVRVTQGASGRVLVNGDDTVRYQPKIGFAGLDGFAYTVSARGGMTATATVSVTVLPKVRAEPPLKRDGS
jgi:hypothetical protein